MSYANTTMQMEDHHPPSYATTVSGSVYTAMSTEQQQQQQQHHQQQHQQQEQQQQTHLEARRSSASQYPVMSHQQITPSAPMQCPPHGFSQQHFIRGATPNPIVGQQMTTPIAPPTMNIPNTSATQPAPPTPQPRIGHLRSSSAVDATGTVPYIPPYPQFPEPKMWKCGYVEIGITSSTNMSSVLTWQRQYVEVRQGEMRMSVTRDNRQLVANAISLAHRCVSIQQKKMVCVQDPDVVYVLRVTSENEALRWFIALSHHCFPAPMMEGYCEKLSGGKKVYETRYIRLGSDGVLSWYRSDTDLNDRRGSIQVRGVESAIAEDELFCVMLRIKSRDYRFKFGDQQETRSWLAAFRWHHDRTPLCDNGKIRNPQK